MTWLHTTFQDYIHSFRQNNLDSHGDVKICNMRETAPQLAAVLHHNDNDNSGHERQYFDCRTSRVNTNKPIESSSQSSLYGARGVITIDASQFSQASRTMLCVGSGPQSNERVPQHFLFVIDIFMDPHAPQGLAPEVFTATGRTRYCHLAAQYFPTVYESEYSSPRHHQAGTNSPQSGFLFWQKTIVRVLCIF